VGYAALAATTSRSQLARAVLWGESDVHDYARFPARKVAAGPTPFRFRHPAGGADVPPVRTVRVLEDGRPVERDLEQFLAASDTTGFLIVRGDTLLYERYFNGYDHDATQTSMSIAKSVLSALVGIAVGEGRIGSVDDPITRYVPELLERDRRFGRITLRHLLTMRSGIRYREAGTPWSGPPACRSPPTWSAGCGSPWAWRPTAPGAWTAGAAASRRWRAASTDGPSTSPSSACCTPAAAPGGAASWCRATGSRTRG
jgi:CubicO group peptidase (beta-lactamase class C family)